MDFSQLDTTKKANEGSFLHFKHPGTGVKLHDGCDPITGAGGDLSKPVGMIMLGSDSDHHTAWKHKRTNQRLTGEDTKLTSEESEIETNAMLANCCLSWLNINHNGNTHHTPENTAEFFKAMKWAGEQALTHFVNRSNFI